MDAMDIDTPALTNHDTQGAKPRPKTLAEVMQYLPPYPHKFTFTDLESYLPTLQSPGIAGRRLIPLLGKLLDYRDGLVNDRPQTIFKLKLDAAQKVAEEQKEVMDKINKLLEELFV